MQLCQCMCHSLNCHIIKTSLPPQPCCECHNINNFDLKNIIEEIENRIIKNHENTIRAELKLNKRITDLEEWTIKDEERIYDRIKKLEKQIQEMRGLSLHPTKPYQCPVCEGCGKDKNRLIMNKEPYTINMKNPECHACEGKGIVWG